MARGFFMLILRGKQRSWVGVHDLRQPQSVSTVTHKVAFPIHKTMYYGKGRLLQDLKLYTLIRIVSLTITLHET